jgi:hypothetical protein
MSDTPILRRSGGNGWHEWSTDTTGTIRSDVPSRFFVRVDHHGDSLVEVVNAQTTTSNETAREVEDGEEAGICLTRDMCAVLEQALREIREMRASDPIAKARAVTAELLQGEEERRG